ncbi:hypothetical protein Tco_1289919 [Tanacetum coccineum]
MLIENQVVIQIMAALAIAISSDSLDESVGSPPSRVILFGDIPTVIPSTFVVVPETSTIAQLVFICRLMWLRRTLVAITHSIMWLGPYVGSIMDSPDEIVFIQRAHFPAPAIFTILIRSKVASRPSSSEFPIAPVTASSGIRRQLAILIRPGVAIPFGRPYCTHLNGLRKFLTTRKRVGPLPARRLAWRDASPRSSYHHPSSSSSSLDSSPVHSSESSSGDSSKRPLHSSSHSVGPSRKRCKSLVDSIPSSTPVMGSLAPTRADILPPLKRFRDSYSSEASIEEDTKVDPIETKVDIELGIGDGDDVRDHVGEIIEQAGEDSSDSSGTRDGIVRSFEDMSIDLDDDVHDFYHHMSKVCIDRIVGIETVQKRLEADQLIAKGERVGMIERIESLRLENLKVRAMLDIERGRVNSLRLHMSLS